MSRHVYKRAENDTHVLEIMPDHDVFESPREWENLGTMICWHRRYSLGDKHTVSSPDDIWQHIAEEISYSKASIILEALEGEKISEEEYKDSIASMVERGAVVLPLYIYEHSGITMSTSGFACPWDSGQVGYIYCTKKRFLEETGYNERQLFGALDKDDIEETSFQEKGNKAVEMLQAEVEIYDHFLTGSVYGFRVLEKDPDEDIPYDEMYEVDSCWGFFGDDFENNGVADQLAPEFRDLVKELK